MPFAVRQIKASINGKQENYSASLKGNVELNTEMDDLASIDLSGTVEILTKGKGGIWTYKTQNVKLDATIANLLEFKAVGMDYNSQDSALAVDQASLKIAALNNTTAIVDKVKITKAGVDWKKATVKTDNIALGSSVTVKNLKASIDGKGNGYSAVFSGKLGFSTNLPEIVKLKSSGILQVTYNGEAKTWSYEAKDLLVNAKIAEILDFEAKDINYDPQKKALLLEQATITIAALNGTTAQANKAQIDQNGLDWSTITFTTKDVKLSELFKITSPKAAIEGAESQYSTTVGGGIEFSLGEYFKASGEGAVKLDRSGAASQLRVEHAKLAAQGAVKFPGSLMVWPAISFTYPLPPFEAGFEMGIEGGSQRAIERQRCQNRRRQALGLFS